MPGFDGTGPMGAGPMTGGGRGYCNPAGAAYGPWCGGGYGRGMGRGRGFKRGFGPGFGMGRGYGRDRGWRGFYPAWGAGYGPAYGYPSRINPEDELQMLREEADAAKSDLEGITKRIQELEAQSQKS
jgi:hypothetical protein